MPAVNPSGEGVPAVMAFESRLGSAVPRLRWMSDSRIHTLTAFDGGPVEPIVNNFVESTLARLLQDDDSNNQPRMP